MNKAMRTRRPHAMMIARLLISLDASRSEPGLSAEDDSVTALVDPPLIVSRLVWKREMAHSSRRMTVPDGPSCRTASGGMRHSEAYQQASGRGGQGIVC